MMLLAMMLMQTMSIPDVPASADQNETIVVIGRAPRNTAAELADCIKRHCPPKQDIALSVAQAQAQFVAGDYLDSRRTLLAARRRNKRYARELPLDVAGLHRATVKMAGLNGLRDEARIGVFDIVDTLKKGLAKNDEQILLARLEVGTAFARSGRFKAALDQCLSVARTARKARLSTVEGLALFQRAALLVTAASVASAYKGEARRAVTEVTARDEPAWLPFRNALRVAPALLVSREDRPSALDAAIRSMEPQPGDVPQLLYAPAIDLGDTASLAGEKTEWMDLDFQIAPDGTVHDVELLRSSDRLRASWVTAAKNALAQRRYAPMAQHDGRAGLHRTERVSFVSDLMVDYGSKQTTRAPDRRAEAQDLNGKTIDQR